ncbi:uncharacterized protein LOC128997018 [Macrosteles quadrilineatus]|uniref:uncharacterized protein LOC128997018 n=1 Tax=Macrosteles quadrilineatus TaxID=74068 RepID=UPI0023E2960A|nr:uncharacterized protein LOC128997018 [Macrosteles quadrilineatus]
MAEDNSFSELENLKKDILLNPTLVVGPYYQDIHKHIADVYLANKQELKGIYHLTEAHAATLRQQTVIRYDYKQDLIKSNRTTSSKIPVEQGIQKKYVDFQSDLAKDEENGLLARLQEMPKEWTVVQITRELTPSEQLKVRPKDTPSEPANIYITRLHCGETLKENNPITVLVEKPEKSPGMPTVYELMKQAIECLRTKKTRPQEIRKEREKGSQYIKDVAEAMSSKMLKEWKCLFTGRLCCNTYNQKIRACIDKVVNSDKFKTYKMDGKDRQLLYQVVDGCVYLNKAEIHSAVCCLVDSKELGIDLIKAINAFKEDMAMLLAARRYPVILIVDDALDGLPWEMLPMFKKHPVSRVPSIHFLHALYHEHKSQIVDGCRLVSNLDLGFYVVNPGQDLKEMESRLMGFLQKRVPQWKGVSGQSPSENEFCSALVDHNVFLYCGHFNGSHYLRPEDISQLRVVALPLLFGCSSVALQDLGGRAEPTGVSDKYIMAGSACVIGMLWTVTSDDTDCMTVMILNSWLPGEPIDLKPFRTTGDMLAPNKEPELLRLMRFARETSQAYSNAAALVARGIPIKMVENK